ncbi:GNAT family N-acetyltransferase [Hyphomicrobiales bacterium]|nr:GNAT family N-acetyltransferase [Hyphomicrobiales bacterium]CAH1701977.1 GNAT family N-acetyltransferase [Hyphomicrobiales bacterium]CAI0346135.1 GNAT family N-acetyltransferase [Hyphomicrobiales bacterium]
MATSEASGIRMREAVAADVPRIATLIMHGAPVQKRTAEQILAEARDPVYLKAFEAVSANPYNTLFVAEREGLVVGTYQITLLPGMAERGRVRAKIESVHVAPEYRGRGIGAVMMRHALAFAAEKGVGLVELTSNKARPEAHRFYRSLGFEQSHEGFKKALPL